MVDAAEKEVSQLESDRVKLLMGMRAGARRVLELFIPAMQQCGVDGVTRNRDNDDDDHHDHDSGHHSPEQQQQLYLSTCSIDDLLDMMLPLSILDRQVAHEDYKGSVTVQGGILIK